MTHPALVGRDSHKHAWDARGRCVDKAWCACVRLTRLDREHLGSMHSSQPGCKHPGCSVCRTGSTFYQPGGLFSRRKGPRVRKTRDEYDIEQKTSEGWEVVCSEDNWRDAQARVREYRENQPEYPVRRRLHRVPITA